MIQEKRNDWNLAKVNIDAFEVFIVIIALLSYSMVGGDSPRDEEADIPMGPVQVVR